MKPHSNLGERRSNVLRPSGKVERKPPTKRPPAKTPEARENQLISLAHDLAEEQIRNGTASSQVISHFLKLGSTRERVEREILIKQRDLIGAKTDSIQSAKRVEELYTNALNAMRRYTGAPPEESDE